MKKSLLNIYAFTLLLLPLLDFKNINLNYIHLLFLIISMLLFYFANCDVEILKEFINRILVEKNKDGIKFSLKEKADAFDKFANSLNEKLTDITITKSDIGERYKNEALTVRLDYTYNLINAKLRELYYLIFPNSQTIPDILIFEELKAKQILSENFCYLIYEYCVLVKEIIKQSNLSIRINDFDIEGLIKHGDNIFAGLVQEYEHYETIVEIPPNGSSNQ